MCPYEGFEANENVIYLGGCPNQHLIPLFDHLIPRYGARPYLVGANYVWGWEMNRLARELVGNAGGTVLGERYLPLEETSVERIIADIVEKRPSFILNNLIGPSSYAFLEAMHALGQRDPAFLPGTARWRAATCRKASWRRLPPVPPSASSAPPPISTRWKAREPCIQGAASRL